LTPHESVRSYTIHKLESFISEIRELKDCEFPYLDSRDALDLLGNFFSDKSQRDVVFSECTKALDRISIYLPILGIILRSTNVRNAFEVYSPLLHLAQKLIAPSLAKNEQVKLILSSEWDFIPFTYSFKILNILPNFVIIGVPATESSNPLIIPLAGHELGHSIWKRKDLELSKYFDNLIIKKMLSLIKSAPSKYSQFTSLDFGSIGFTSVDDLVGDTNVVETISQGVDWALMQAEETFCDFVGLRIFGVSFLKAFAFLLSPQFSAYRSEEYPQLSTRVADLKLAAKNYGVPWPRGYEKQFDDSISCLSGKYELLLDLADKSLEKILPELINRAKVIVAKADIPTPSKRISTRIGLHYSKYIAPAEKSQCLGNILNAAWNAYEDNTLWKNHPDLTPKDRLEILKDLVLKNIELLEIENRLDKHA
jgi:hypothetical protein